MQFGIYLLKQRTITAEQLIEAMQLQVERVVPLGIIAMEEGRLAVRDVLSILRVQSDLPNDRFGDIAIDLGLMSRRDLAELLMIQSDRRMPIGDCLVELDILTSEQVDESLAAFRRDRERGGAGHVQRVVQQMPVECRKEIEEFATSG